MREGIVATWHQLKANVRLFHDTEWTVVEDPPNNTRTLSTFTTEAGARWYLDRVKKLRPHVPAYLLKPAKGAS